jgi:multicomponent Na+:H+ antiporter subunit G
VIRDLITLLLLFAGAGFFLAGSLGVVRFPDLYTRLHALTKADNLGLGLLALGLAIRAGDAGVALKLALIWGLAVTGSALAAHLLARTALRRGVSAWERPR